MFPVPDPKASLGLTEPSVRARAACSLASAVAQDTDSSRAVTLAREGLEQLPGGTPFTLDRVYCLLRASEVARIQVQPREAIAHALAAQRLLEATRAGRYGTLGDMTRRWAMPSAATRAPGPWATRRSWISR